MRKLVLGLALCALAALPAAAAPTYYMYNLAALGLANNNVDAPEFYIGSDLFSRGEVVKQLNAPGQTSDPTVQANPYLSSVPFSLSPSGNGTANDAWSAQTAAGGSWSSSDPTLTLPGNNIYGPYAVFLMMNTIWGNTTGNVQVVLQFEGGASETFTLFGGTDTRDHNDTAYFSGTAIYPNTINNNLRNDGNGKKVTTNVDTIYTNDGHKVYRDVVTLFVDPTFANSRLTNILINDLGNGPWADGYRWQDATRSFVWGVTVASIPEPSTWAMLASGLALAALKLRRRK